jgi:two-component system, OmpR family, sensor histidine kinase BaeS
MTLTRKLTLAFLLIAITAAAIVAVSIRLTNTTRLSQLVLEQQRANFETLVVDYYQRTGSLNGIDAFMRQALPNAQTNPNPQPVQPDRRNLFGLANAQGIVVVPMTPDLHLGQRVTTQRLAQGQRVEVNGVFIGTILSPPTPPGLTPQEQVYLDRTNQALTIAAISAALLALIVGFLLARTLTRPLRALTEATEKMAGGDLNQQVTITSHDEIGELAVSFNRMSHQVARANQLRKQMTADIAHDLRTPLTVIAGYVESMRDGDLAPTPERLDTIYAEIERLQRLVQDLRLLAVTDAGELHLNLAPLNPNSLLERVAAFKFSAEQKGVILRVEAETSLPNILADESRLDRVLSNLVSNAIRHTPPGGTVSILATRKNEISALTNKGNGRGEYLLISVEDTGEGIPPADLPHIFDRFYRADRSRTDADGASSGLGLAIAKALVEAHGGRIWAESEVGIRTKIMMEIPTNQP